MIASCSAELLLAEVFVMIYSLARKVAAASLGPDDLSAGKVP